MIQQTFQVKGMHCASCSSIITKKLQKLPGIESCDVNFATEKANISFDDTKVTTKDMNNEINKLGYQLSSDPHAEHNMSDMKSSSDKMMANGEDHAQHLGLNLSKDEKLEELEKLRVKVDFGIPLSLLVFAFMMWDIGSNIFPNNIPEFPIPMPLFNTISFIISTIFMFWIGRPYLVALIRFIKYRVANMDSLVGIGTFTAYLYSSTVLLFPGIGNYFALPQYLYFDVAIVVIGFITLGKYLEARSKLKTGEAIEKLLNLQAKTALVVREGKEIEVPISEVVVGDIIRVKPGGKVPVDGVIISGTTSIDESMINGEPVPNDKKSEDFVIGSTMNKQGSFLFKASKVGSDTMLAQIVRMVEESQGSKAEIQNLADKVSSVFIPSVLVIAVVTFLLWISLGTYLIGFSTAFSYALLSFVGILVIACPCALGLATPTAIIVGVGKGAEHGILIKNAQSLEKLHKINMIVLDKTGTLTHGKPTVTDIISLDSSITEEEILQLSASLENNSQHPLATAVVAKSKDQKINIQEVSSFSEEEGVGVKGIIKNSHVEIRKPASSETHLSEIAKLQGQGKTVIIVIKNEKVIGLLAISDTIKPGVQQTIEKLHKLGIRTAMITGDNQKAAEHIAKQVGIDTVKAEILPQDKSNIIKELQKEGRKVAMVGDGINDAPALTQADVGIAMATGTDIAIESSDITLLSGDLSKIPQAIKLSRSTIRTVKQNLFWAFIYNIIGIPLAAGLFYPIFGIFLNPIFAGLAMGLSSVSVVSNSLLLKRLKL
ncbi:MAG: heavy metal translocating P-type ATPase [Candidatus Levybacteria bacterium]|nr:heavy metal translocating P-type ATPase [Candidatus Levybacteria bacterium]